MNEFTFHDWNDFKKKKIIISYGYCWNDDIYAIIEQLFFM